MSADSVWTISALKEHFDALRDADRKALNAALTSSEKAILKAEAAADDRFRAANEIRGAMRDAQENFANKGQTELQMQDLKRRLESLEKNEVRTSGSLAGARGLWGYVVAGATFLLTFVAWANGRLG